MELVRCEWCLASSELDESRVVRSVPGAVLMRGADGRVHKFKHKENGGEQEQETQGSGTEAQAQSAFPEDFDEQARETLAEEYPDGFREAILDEGEF